MDLHFGYYIFCLVAVIAGIVIVKKITGCMVRLAIVSAVVIILAIVYFLYFR